MKVDIDLTENEKIIREHHEQLYVNILDNYFFQQKMRRKHFQLIL